VKNTATSLLNLIFGKNQSKTITANRVLFKGILFWKYFIALCLADCCNKRRFVDSKCLQRSPDPLAGFNVSFLHLFLFFFPHRSHLFFTFFVFVRCPRSLWHYATLISSFNNNNNNGLREWHGRDNMGEEREGFIPLLPIPWYATVGICECVVVALYRLAVIDYFASRIRSAKSKASVWCLSVPFVTRRGQHRYLLICCRLTVTFAIVIYKFVWLLDDFCRGVVAQDLPLVSVGDWVHVPAYVSTVLSEWRRYTCRLSLVVSCVCRIQLELW